MRSSPVAEKRTVSTVGVGSGVGTGVGAGVGEGVAVGAGSTVWAKAAT